MIIAKKYREELDLIIERLMTGEEAADGLDKGRAEIACYFLAILEDSRSPDIVKVRNEAILRFKRRTAIQSAREEAHP